MITSQKEYKRTDDNINLIIDHSPAVLWASGENGETIYISSNVEKIYGFTPQEIYDSGDKLWIGRIHDDDREMVLNEFEKLFSENKSLDIEYRIKHKNGKWIWLNDKASIVNEIDGKKYAYGLFIDITEKRELQDNSAKHNLLYQTLFESAADGIFIMDREVFVDCNKRTLELFGLKHEDEIIGKSPIDFSPEKQSDGIPTRTKVKEIIERAFTGVPQSFEWQHSKLSGQVFDAEVRLHLVELKKKPLLVAIVRDITERKKAERELKQSADNFRNIFDNSNDAILISNLDGIIVNANGITFKKLGYTKNEVIGKRITDMVSEKYREKIIKRIEEVKQNMLSPLEIEINSKNNKIIYAESVSKIIEYDGKKMILSIVRDVTDRKNIQKEILNSIISAEEQERARMARDLHDGLGPVLSTLKLYLQWLSDDTKKTNKSNILAKTHETLEEAIYGLREISNNVSPHILKNHGLSHAINSFIDRLNETSSIEIIFTYNEISRFKDTIETTLYRIIIECINNTLKYAEATLIDINMLLNHDELRLNITDNGCGFDVDKVKKNKKGMGLINMENRINTLGGNFQINSIFKKGTTILITLPRYYIELKDDKKTQSNTGR